MRISDWSSDVCSSDLTGSPGCLFSQHIGIFLMNIGLQDRSWPQVIQVVKKKQIRPTVPVPGITKITGQGNTADKFLNNFFRQESKDVTCLAKIFRQVNIDVLFHEVGYLIGLMLHANSETVSCKPVPAWKYPG